MANLLITELGLGDAGYAFDLQLLPYCPITANSSPINCGYGSDKTFSMIGDGNNNYYSFICFPTSANFTKYIPIEKNYKHLKTSGVYGEWEDVTATWNSDGELYMMEVPLPDIPINAVSVSGHVQLKYNGTYINGAQLNVEENPYDPPTFDWSYGFLDDPVITFWIYMGDYLGNTITFSNVYAEIEYQYYQDPTPLEMKVNNECDFCRLTSPNFNGMYQFKLSKLQDGLHYINVDCTYKPQNPYIKLNPDFSFLYGQDFNDSVGLILGGDFSLPLMTDPWNQYELQNKNYQNIFNRSIQNLDVNNQIAKEQTEFQGIMGAISSGVKGGAAGAVTGAKAGPYGAVIGAAVGASAGIVGGAIGAAKDLDWLNRAQAETRDYAVDNYRFQLGTIQALPSSITKSSPLTYNNKVWPILEEFSCTDAEKEVIRNRIIYDGMNVMAIGKLADYDNSNELDKVFVKGQLIRLEDIKDDFHVADEVYKEVQKGFYVKGD